MPKDMPTLKNLLEALGLEPVCEHELMLRQMALFLTAAAMRHGGRLTLSRDELQDATTRVLSLHASPPEVVVQSLTQQQAQAQTESLKAQNAPGTETVQ